MVEKVVVPEMKKAYEIHRPFEFWLLDQSVALPTELSRN